MLSRARVLDRAAKGDLVAYPYWIWANLITGDLPAHRDWHLDRNHSCWGWFLVKQCSACFILPQPELVVPVPSLIRAEGVGPLHRGLLVGVKGDLLCGEGDRSIVD